MQLMELVCAGCGVQFAKPKSEVKRQRRAGRQRFWCGLACHAKHSGKANLGQNLVRGRPENLDSSNRLDRYSPFRYFLRKARSRGGETDLDLPFLEALWSEQRGRCALSGIAMEMPPSTLAWETQSLDPWKPSLDRIDSARGYLKGNVRFVTVLGNMAKGRYSDADLMRFCRAVVERNRDGGENSS